MGLWFHHKMKGEDGKRPPVWLNTRTLFSHFIYGPYVLLPLVAAFTWLGGILALLGLWVAAGKPRYKSDEASVVFISDVGATHQTLFIIICCIVAAFYMTSLFAERWLRHLNRLPTDLRRRELVFDWLAIFFGIVGSVGLILLSCFNAFTHGTPHWIMTIVFVVGVAISAVFQSAEIWHLHRDHPDRKSLKRNTILKLLVVIVAIAGAITFGATYGVCYGSSSATNGHSASKCNTITSVAASMEWAIAFILTFYFLTLAADLWPAGKSSPRYMRSLAKWQERHGEGHDFTGRRAFGMYPERWQDREQAMRENMLARNRGLMLADQQTGDGLGGGDLARGSGTGYTTQPRIDELNGSMPMRETSSFSTVGTADQRTSNVGSEAPIMRQNMV